MKIYSIRLSILLCSLALFLVGCDNNKTPESKSELTTTIVNSYLFHTEPETLPHSKLIKQQRIEGDGERVINYNEQGYVANYDLQGLHAEINYDTAKYIYGIQDNKTEYAVTFDADKNIVGMTNSNGDIVASSEFDEQGHVIETTLSNFADNNMIFHSQVIYEQDLVELVIYTAAIQIDENTLFPVFVQEKDFIYNTNHQLEKTTNTTFKLSSDGKILIDQQNQQEVESTETCTYSDYNMNNDWTKAQCITTGSESKTVNLTRTIQYE